VCGLQGEDLMRLTEAVVCLLCALSVVGRAFSAAVPRIWNSLPDDDVSALTVEVCMGMGIPMGMRFP